MKEILLNMNKELTKNVKRNIKSLSAQVRSNKEHVRYCKEQNIRTEAAELLVSLAEHYLALQKSDLATLILNAQKLNNEDILL